MIDGILLQTAEGLDDASFVATGGEIWEWLQGEKEKVARKILSDGPLSHKPVGGMQESEASEAYCREVEWQYRGHLEARLREINEAQDRLMDGAYGRCTDCGAEIGRRRLSADPAATLCITCRKGVEGEAALLTL